MLNLGVRQEAEGVGCDDFVDVPRIERVGEEDSRMRFDTVSRGAKTEERVLIRVRYRRFLREQVEDRLSKDHALNNEVLLLREKCRLTSNTIFGFTDCSDEPPKPI